MYWPILLFIGDLCCLDNAESLFKEHVGELAWTLRVLQAEV
jgi:hypothetical protein